jgi:hypothetical protein
MGSSLTSAVASVFFFATSFHVFTSRAYVSAFVVVFFTHTCADAFLATHSKPS